MVHSKPTLHMIGLFHTIPNHDYDHCAFTGKVLRFAKMMQAYGYEVIEYSNGESISGATEIVQILTTDEVAEYRESVDNFMKLAVIGSPMWKRFEEQLIKEVSRRIKQHDIICHPFGDSHKTLVSIFPSAFHVETGIGYNIDDFGAFRVFESYAWMHYFQGKQGRYGRAYEWAIPNYYDVSDWEPRYEKGDYILYLGRVCEEKGLHIVKEVSNYFNECIIVAGMGETKNFEARNMKFIGPVVGQKERSDLIRHARVVIMPTQYVEPFGGVAVEAQLCGTPVVSSDYGAFAETIEHGKTGYRCHTLGDFITGIIASELLDRKYISDRARSLYSLEVVGKQYDSVFKQICDLKQAGWYSYRSHYIEEPKLIWEERWWGDCKNTAGEEQKQIVYGKYMGLGYNDKKYLIDGVDSAKVIDIGGGPVSMLLKTPQVLEGKVYDPGTYPEWVMERYLQHNITYVKVGGEKLSEINYDEVWIYNCLQHTEDPELIIQNAKKAARTIRIFEWVDTPEHIGHPQTLTQEKLEKWLGQSGRVEYIDENGAVGKCFYGVFNF